MKILFINISDIQGGSAKAAFRLGQQLERNFNTKNLFLVRTKLSNEKNVLQTRQNQIEHFFERAINIFMNLIGLQYQWLPFSPKFVLKKAAEFQPDIISLHNTIGGYFRTKDLAKLSNIAPIVWTMHDMWPITRNCAHTFGDESFTKMKSFPGERKIFPWIGIDSGSFLLRKKKTDYETSDISFVCPSLWLYNLACKSPLLDGKKISHIYHGIDTDKFRIMDKAEVRKSLGINPDSKVLMFVAEKLKSNSWKGGLDLSDVVKELSHKFTGKITLILLGNTAGYKIDESKIDIVTPGYINNEEELVKYYNASDIFIYPTKAESFGLVLAEAIACGTPCASYDVGPVAEIIKNGVSGITVQAGDTSKLVSKILELLQNESNLQNLSKTSREHAEDNFSLDKMAQNYLSLFKKVLVNKNNSQ